MLDGENPSEHRHCLALERKLAFYPGGSCRHRFFNVALALVPLSASQTFERHLHRLLGHSNSKRFEELLVDLACLLPERRGHCLLIERLDGRSDSVAVPTLIEAAYLFIDAAALNDTCCSVAILWFHHQHQHQHAHPLSLVASLGEACNVCLASLLHLKVCAVETFRGQGTCRLGQWQVQGHGLSRYA